MSRPARLLGWLTSRLGSAGVDPQTVRAEAWALGGRHQGRVADGARKEMLAPGVTAQRAALLRAVVRAEDRKAGGAT